MLCQSGLVSQDLAAAQCYDFVGILEHAAQHASEGKSIKDALKSISSYQGASGTMRVPVEQIFAFDTLIKQGSVDKFVRAQAAELAPNLQGRLSQ